MFRHAHAKFVSARSTIEAAVPWRLDAALAAFDTKYVYWPIGFGADCPAMTKRLRGAYAFMARPNRMVLEDLRGAARLAIDATIGITELVEKMHHTIQLRHLPLGASRANVTRGLTGLVYRLLGHWPRSVQELVIIGHSMGGLVARSACHYARLDRHDWLRALRRLVFLGTPHHGAPLERGGHRLDRLMEMSPYLAPFTRLGKARSAGITDLRHGSVTFDAQECVPLPDDVECYALAATFGKRRSPLADRLIGDGLVPLNSALGQHADGARRLAIPQERQWVGYEMGHLELLGRPEVYAQLRKWLR